MCGVFSIKYYPHMTELLYLVDAYQKTAKTTVIEVGTKHLILDQTIFYPQGGGQPSDKGTIKSTTGELHIKEVEYNAGAIKHKGNFKGSFAVGQSVTLEIDWPLRLKHMQWHTAGHLVDLVVRETYPNLTPKRGMHGIGKKLFIEYEEVHKLNTLQLNTSLQKYITSQPKIETRFVTLEELKKIANWLPPKLPSSKKLRILSIGDRYHIPDGGTQLKTNDVIWSVTITSIEHTNSTTLVHYAVEQPKAHFDNSNYSSKNLAKNLDHIHDIFTTGLSNATSLNQIELLRIKYLGKNGITSKLLQELPKLPGKDKRTYGPLLNKLKADQAKMINAKLSSIAHQPLAIDLTIPGTRHSSGRLHPTTTVIREMNEFFRYLGFSIGEGPEIESAEYNFRRLNLPEGHPATDLQDTLFIQERDLLMRTHTSSVETRILSTHKPPLRVVVPGKVYRNETNSATNTSFFYQYQGFVVDQGITIAHLKDTLTKFHQFLFGKSVKLRFRYKYYPEVSPGMGVDMECRFCQGRGCHVCKGRGYIEVLGSGMIHTQTLRACGIDPEVYTGYAFGMGLDRLVMSKYGIQDIRKLYSGELVYL